MYAEKTENKDKGSEEAKTEHFSSRGMGIDYSPGCFVCGNKFVNAYIEDSNKKFEAYKKEFTNDQIKRMEESLRRRQMIDNISGFVYSKESGERIVNGMFNNVGAWLDYREREPNWIQVKIGACSEHLENLKKLNELTIESGTITKEMVDQARNYRIPRR